MGKQVTHPTWLLHKMRLQAVSIRKKIWITLEAFGKISRVGKTGLFAHQAKVHIQNGVQESHLHTLRLLATFTICGD